MRLYLYGAARALLAGILLGIVLLALLWFFWGSLLSADPVHAIYPDPRIRWTPYPVGGLILARDTTWVRLPPGSVLWVPSAGDTLDALDFSERRYLRWPIPGFGNLGRFSPGSP